jgi:hypothetical protein
MFSISSSEVQGELPGLQSVATGHGHAGLAQRGHRRQSRSRRK